MQIPGDPLKITLFYEAYCPDCQDFIIEQLYPAYLKLADYIDLDLVPFGNVKVYLVIQVKKKIPSLTTA